MFFFLPCDEKQYGIYTCVFNENNMIWEAPLKLETAIRLQMEIFGTSMELWRTLSLCYFDGLGNQIKYIVRRSQFYVLVHVSCCNFCHECSLKDIVSLFMIFSNHLKYYNFILNVMLRWKGELCRPVTVAIC